MRNILILFTILSLSCCEKDKDKTDYRNKYIGNYKCYGTGYFFSGGYFGIPYTTTKDDTSVVVNITKSGDSLINILDAQLKLYNNGEFGGGLYPSPNYHGFYGHFNNDSIYFSTYQGGLGTGRILNYKGEKLMK